MERFYLNKKGVKMDLDEINYSLWCDFIHRDFLHNGFGALLSYGVNGATSNPSIFANALESQSYKKRAEKLKQENGSMNTKEIYENLGFSDIKTAAQILTPLYNKNQDNGYISIEIDPFLCDDAPKSIDEGVRIFQSIGKPNVMIKVPATQAGYEVMNALIAKNIPVNATLIFSPNQANQCMQAFAQARKGNSIARGVVSIFVSRFDRAYNAMQDTKDEVKNTLGIANAKKCYSIIQDFDDKFSRPLFASTGVKGDDLPKDYYITSLILPKSINTAPLDALQYFVQEREDWQEQVVDSNVQKILNLVDEENLTQMYNTLLADGLNAFKQSFEEMLAKL